jgi:MSHA pilin protein MshA
MKALNKTQQGFTLVELIIVIVILGILAVTAAPRFLNFTGDAREAVLQSVEGAIKAGNSMIYGKAAIAGQTGNPLSCYARGTQTVAAETDGTAITANAGEDATPATNCTVAASVDLVFGYLDAEEEAFAAGLSLADFSVADAETGAAYTIPVAVGTVRIAGSAEELDPALPANACYVTYTQAANANAEPDITITDNGCN